MCNWLSFWVLIKIRIFWIFVFNNFRRICSYLSFARPALAYGHFYDATLPHVCYHPLYDDRIASGHRPTGNSDNAYAHAYAILIILTILQKRNFQFVCYLLASFKRECFLASPNFHLMSVKLCPIFPVFSLFGDRGSKLSHGRWSGKKGCLPSPPPSVIVRFCLESKTNAAKSVAQFALLLPPLTSLAVGGCGYQATKSRTVDADNGATRREGMMESVTPTAPLPDVILSVRKGFLSIVCCWYF